MAEAASVALAGVAVLVMVFAVLRFDRLGNRRTMAALTLATAGLIPVLVVIYGITGCLQSALFWNAASTDGCYDTPAQRWLLTAGAALLITALVLALGPPAKPRTKHLAPTSREAEHTP